METTASEIPKQTTREWICEHLDMQPTLEVYQKGIDIYGPTQFENPDQEKIKLITDRVSFRFQHDDIEPDLTEDEICTMLTVFRKDWLEEAAFSSINYEHTAHPLIAEYGDNYAIAGIQQDNNKYGDPSAEIIEHDTHYIPGRYDQSSQGIVIYDAPTSIKDSISPEARKQYTKGLILHEFLHSVLREDADYHFLIDGKATSYYELLKQFHEICQEESESTTQYSELYATHREDALYENVDQFSDEQWPVKLFLEEELGELISSTLLEWSATPQGEAKLMTERNNLTKKRAFALKVLNAQIIKTEQ